jgi:hypothetical protein
VNDIIGRTIDAVQDEIIEEAQPSLRIVDFALGPFDEWMTSKLIAHWREEVWQNATGMLAIKEPEAREQRRRQVEAAAVQRAKAILFEEGSRGVLGIV